YDEPYSCPPARPAGAPVRRAPDAVPARRRQRRVVPRGAGPRSRSRCAAEHLGDASLVSRRYQRGVSRQAAGPGTFSSAETRWSPADWSRSRGIEPRCRMTRGRGPTSEKATAEAAHALARAEEEARRQK